MSKWLLRIGLLMAAGMTLYLIDTQTDWIDLSLPLEPSPASVSFELVQQEVFRPACFSCHSMTRMGELGLDNYKEVKDNLGRIRRATLEKPRMPPNRPLRRSQRAVLKAWLDAGAPEFAQPKP